MRKSQTQIVFIDTSIFESENYFEGRNINLLLHLSQENLISLKITDIIYREIQKRLEEHSNKAVNLYKNQKIEFNQEARILRNINLLNDQFKKDNIKSLKENSRQLLLQKFDETIKNNNIEIINTNIADASEILDDYFAIKSPFKEGNKKNEFPDAFNINTIKHWCKKNFHNCFFITNDKDFTNYEHPQINCEFNLSTLLELLYVENSDIKEEIFNRIYQDSLSEIEYETESSLTSSLESFAFEVLYNDPWMEDVEVNFHAFEEIQFDIVLINEIKTDTFTYEIELNIKYSVDCDYTDLNSALYDKEDGIWLGEVNRNEKRNFKANCLVYPLFSYDSKKYTGEFKEIVDYEIREIEEI
uniref:PIN domain-containing protein n=1 Tax=Chryseobacterium endophyticum TaxID=1854762 RepID=A0AAU6WP78_9FLAO